MAHTILIADDEPDVLNLQRRKLEVNGYHVLCAQDGQEAISIIHNEHIDLIVSDIVMPQMDGLELCQNLKKSQNTSHIPIIITSAYSDRNKTFEDLGIYQFLNKPFPMTVMLETIKKALHHHKSNSQHYRLLIQDPDPFVLQELCQISESYGWHIQIEAAQNEQHLLLKAAQDQYNIILVAAQIDPETTLKLVRLLSSSSMHYQPTVIVYTPAKLYQHSGLPPYFVQECLKAGASRAIELLTPMSFMLMLYENL